MLICIYFYRWADKFSYQEYTSCLKYNNSTWTFCLCYTFGFFFGFPSSKSIWWYLVVFHFPSASAFHARADNTKGWHENISGCQHYWFVVMYSCVTTLTMFVLMSDLFHKPSFFCSLLSSCFSLFWTTLVFLLQKNHIQKNKNNISLHSIISVYVRTFMAVSWDIAVYCLNTKGESRLVWSVYH